jgi:hypothetical protein
MEETMLTEEKASDATHNQDDVIGTIQATIEGSKSKQEEKTALLEALQSLRRAKDRSSFLKRATLFLGSAANCTELALHINTWSLVLSELGANISESKPESTFT